MELDFNAEFKKALKIIEEGGKNIFLTGRAGTGKSTFLNYFIENTEKNIVVLAPTGVAALNIGGETIHSFFRFAPSVTQEKAEKQGRKSKEEKFQKMETLVIDEVSMVRADLMDCVDVFLKNVRDDFRPFGGVQIVVVGDLYQLPPVVRNDERMFFRDYYSSPYFFSSHVFQSEGFEMEFVELEKIYRQTDSEFISLLNAVRNRSINTEHLKKLNEKVKRDFKNTEGFITLTSTNQLASDINKEELARVKTSSYFFEADVYGDFKAKDFPTDEVLTLKEGAQVMFLNNDNADRWVNGTVGKITEITEEGAWVELFSGKKVFVDVHTWDVHKYEYDEKLRKLEAKIIGSFAQLPVRLAWAVTIHKSQGKTFENTIIDLGNGSFAHGQTYVALSRCTNFDGIILRKPIRMSDIRLDYSVVKFMEWLKNR